jgi:CRP/FNR family transcriptional regulator/CRP/FNR family cyclic AMP-dependent transcriptional regulator
MYVIASGRVRVHDGQHTLDYLDRGEIFGEMALLGPETRMASVTAVVETHLLRLHREPFHSLLARHPEMAQGMIRVLMRRLRAQAQEVTTLRARLQQSEG